MTSAICSVCNCSYIEDSGLWRVCKGCARSLYICRIVFGQGRKTIDELIAIKPELAPHVPMALHLNRYGIPFP